MLLIGMTVAVVGCLVSAPSPGAPTSSPGPATADPATAGPTTAVPETALPPEPTPTTFRHGPAGLVEDLVDAGADAAVADSFDGQPLATEQIVVCVDGEDVRVFAYSSEQERAAVSARIDPTDPTDVGTAIIEWDGWPQFWQRDRIIVLYLGSNEDTIELLTELMGDPFAQGEQRPQRLPGAC